ncbi:DUF5590 domain-containing protein [Paenibacillus sp. NPDC058071]|uniref:cell wall elongation regulator TseB-like domain-containing protein n=1 Tax=Paenibacillus sp. NPDC058071 TaxID=3346326 RepID=UPI0036DA2098
MTPKRWAAVIGVLLAALIGASLIYYQMIHAGSWSEERQAQQQAANAAGLTEIGKTTKYVWDKPYWIVEGKNEAGEDLYVFIELSKEETAEGSVASAEPRIIKATEAYGKENLIASFSAQKPDADIKRIQPGTLNGELVWEVYYSRKEDMTKYYYDFYKFGDGTFIDQYKLPAKHAG